MTVERHPPARGRCGPRTDYAEAPRARSSSGSAAMRSAPEEGRHAHRGRHRRQPDPLPGPGGPPGARHRRDREAEPGGQLLQAQKMEAVGRLAGGVAHDFNNLLGVITGYGELLRARAGRRTRGSPSTSTRSEGRRAGRRLTRQLLAFSRKQVLQPRVLDLNEVVDEIEKMLRRLIGEDIELVTDARRASGRVRADPGQIEQVLMNLAVNARDAMPRGGQAHRSRPATSTWTRPMRASTRTSSPGRYVMLAVTDTGHGMDAGRPGPHLRAVLHDQGAGQGHRAGPGHRLRDREAERRAHLASTASPATARRSRSTCRARTRPRTEPIARAVAGASSRGTRRSSSSRTRRACGSSSASSSRRRLHGARGAAPAPRPCESARATTGPIHLLLTDVVMPRMSGRELAERLGARGRRSGSSTCRATRTTRCAPRRARRRTWRSCRSRSRPNGAQGPRGAGPRVGVFPTTCAAPGRFPTDNEEPPWCHGSARGPPPPAGPVA